MNTNTNREATINVSDLERLELCKDILTLSPEDIKKVIDSPEAQGLSDKGKQFLEIVLMVQQKKTD